MPVMTTPNQLPIEMNAVQTEQQTLPRMEAVAAMTPETGKVAAKRMQKKTEKTDAKIDQLLPSSAGK